MTVAAHRFWMAVHRYSGLAMLVFLAFAALTGSVLVFTRVLDEAINADLFRQAAVRGAPPVAPLVDRFRARHPDVVVTSFPLAVPADARIPVKIAPDPRRGVNQLFLDRATGALVAARSDAPALTRRGATRLLHDIHYTLMLDKWGRWLMGLVAAAWLCSNLVGSYLTFPLRGAFWKQWKRTWRFSLKSSFPRQMLDIHRASGLWLLAPLTALALTSVCMNFFAEAYTPLVEWAAPERAQPLPSSPATGPLNFAGAVRQAQAFTKIMHRRWQPATAIYEADDKRFGVTLTDDGTLNYHALGPIYLYFDAATGRLAEVVDPYHGNRTLALYRWLYTVHSGRIAGGPTVALVFVLGLVTFGMCVTGVYLWLKRRPMRRSKKKIGR